MTLDPCIYFAVNLLKKEKQTISLGYWKACFFTWQTVTYEDTIFTSILKVCNSSADQTRQYSTSRLLRENKVHSFYGMGRPAAAILHAL